MAMTSDDAAWTMPVAAAGKRYFNLGRSASYRAAKAGAIPTVRVNGKVLALPRIIEAQLNQPERSTPAPDSNDKAA